MMAGVVAGMVLTNLFYVIGAIAAAAAVSAIVLLRHRRPKSLEAGIEMFSRELKALEPDRSVARPLTAEGLSGASGHGGAAGAVSPTGGGDGRLGALRRRGAVRPLQPSQSPVSSEQGGRGEAGASSPDPGTEPG